MPTKIEGESKKMNRFGFFIPAFPPIQVLFTSYSSPIQSLCKDKNT